MTDKQKTYKDKFKKPDRTINIRESDLLPPSAIELEQSIIGAILLEQQVLVEIVKILHRDIFYKEEHQIIFGAIQKLYEEHEPVDILTVTNKLKQLGELDFIGGAYAITQLTNNVASSTHCEFHARIIIQKYIQRELIRISSKTIKEAYNDTTDVFDLLQQAQENFDKVVLSSVSITGKIKYYTVSDIQSNLNNLAELGIQRGHDVGFNCLKEYYSIKLGSTTYCMGSPSHGKCLGKGTKIIMYDGTLKRVEDIIVGDILMGDNSTPRNVLSTNTGTEEMFWVRQNKGIDYRVNKSHILSLIKTKVKKKDRKFLKGHIVDISVDDYLKSSNNFKRYYKGYKVAIDFPQQELLIDPYYLGLWLGDGRSAGGDIANMDPEIIDYMRNYSEKLGFRFSEYKNGTSDCSSYAIVGHKTNAIQGRLKKLNLINNKHIPFSYIKNSRENRLKLLAGIIDTDGFFNSRSCYAITQKNNKLIYDIKYLADTLGFRTRITNIKKRSQTGVIGNYLNLTISGNIQEIPILVSRKKLIKYKPTRINTSIKIESDGVGEYFGFSIDGNKRFLLEDGTVTHNTEWWLEALINTSMQSGWRHVLYTPETGNKEEIIAELCYKYIGKPFYKTTYGCMSDEERMEGLAWIGKHFFIVDPEDEPMTISNFFEIVDKIEKEQGKIHTTTIDPFNEIAHDFRNDEGRQDLYIERVLGNIRKNAQKYKRHNCVITHCRDQPPIVKNGITYFPPPTARDYAGGQAWFRKGNSMLAFWRPPVGLPDENGIPYTDNELRLLIQKAKPKGTGRKGEVKLFFNSYKNRFFELIEGKEVYALETANQTAMGEQNNSITPNTDFFKEKKNDNEFEESPF